MDFKAMLNQLSQLSEATKETPTGKVHKADPGGYGRKDDEDDKKKEKEKAAEPAVKRGRGRPKKGADSETGEVAKYANAPALQSFMVGNLPKGKLPGKTTKKHTLKDWMEIVQDNMLAEAEQITIEPAKASTQVIRQGTKTLGTVSNPQLATQIKQSIGKGEMSLAGSELDEDGMAEGLENTPSMIAKLFSDNKQLFDMAAQGKITPQLKKLVSIWGASTPWGMNTDTRNPEWIDGVLQHLVQNYYPSWKAKQGVAEGVDFGRADKVADDVIMAHEKGQPYYFGPGEDTPEFMAAVADMLRNAGRDDLADEVDPSGSNSGVAEGKLDYSAKKARAGQDIGKPGKQFAKIAKGAAERYGSEEKGKKVAGAVLKNLRSKTNEADIPSDQMDMGAGLGAGRSSTTLEGKKAKPDFLDLDKDKNKKESMAKAAKDAKKKKKVTESSHRHSAAKLLGKSHALAKEGYNCRFEDMDEARMYHEGYKEGLDECYGQGVYEMAPPATVPGMASAAMSMPSMEEDMFDEAMFDEGNAFTGALANTPKGGKFSLGGQTFTDTSDLEEMSLAFESLDKQLKSLLESEEVTEGMTVSISKGQQGMPDSVTVSAQDGEADQLLGLIKQAGLGLFGDNQSSGYVAPQDSQDTKMHGDISVVGDHDGMMGLMKKFAGIEGSQSQDYEDEENHDEHDDHDHGEEEVCETCHQAQCQCEDTEQVQEVESENQMEFEVAEDQSDAQADEAAEAEEDKALAIQNSKDDEQVEESLANGADDTFEADIHFMTDAISSGLNKKKSTGQTTIPVIAGQTDRMGYNTNESVQDWKKLAGIK